MTISFDDVMRNTSNPRMYCINESCVKFCRADRYGCVHTSNTQNCIRFKSALTLNPTYEIDQCRKTIKYLKDSLEKAIHDLPIQKIIEEHRESLCDDTISLSRCIQIIDNSPDEITEHEKKLKDLEKNLAAITLP